MKAASAVQDMLHELPRYLLVLAAVSVLALLAQAAAPSSSSALPPMPSPGPVPLANGRDASPAPNPQSSTALPGDLPHAATARAIDAAPTAAAPPAHGKSRTAR